MKLLFATRTSPFSGESGSGAYAADVLHFLAQRGWTIRVAWTEPPELGPSDGWYHLPSAQTAAFDLKIVDMMRIGGGFWRPSLAGRPLRARGLRFAKSALRRLGLRRPPARGPAARVPESRPAWGARCSPREREFVARQIGRFRPDVVLANYPWTAPAARTDGGPPVAVLTADVRHRQVHLRDGQTIEVLGEYASADDERDQLAGADLLVAIQSAEAEVFRRLLPGIEIVIAPPAVVPQPLPPPAAPAAIFVGSAHSANRGGLEWLRTRVWPSVAAAVPAARLLVAGRICDTLAPAAADLAVVGRLPDLAAAYRGASLAVVPVLRGSGVKIKLIEAVSHARTVVTTSVGIEGLQVLSPVLDVADTDDAFARALITRLSDPAETDRRGRRALAVAAQSFSPAACYGALDDSLHRLALARGRACAVAARIA